MGLTKVRLGDCLQIIDRKNENGVYGINDARGVNNQKKMIPTKADISNRDLAKFQVVEPGEFFFNHRTSRNGSKFSITYNHDHTAHITTEDYVLFAVSATNILEPMWLYLYVCRSEFDRYVIMNSWGSSTEFYNWDDLCDVEINLPPIDIQRKYSAIYESMLANQRCYERGLDDLKLSYDAIFDKIKDNSHKEALGGLVCEADVRNKDLHCKVAFGINATKNFVISKASSEDLRNYKTVRPGQIACNLMHIGRDAAFPISRNSTGTNLIVSPAYIVADAGASISPDYLVAWMDRPEVGRYGWFVCDDNIRSGMSKSRFLELPIPVPSKRVQKEIVEIRTAFENRNNINEKLKQQLKDICPILIKGSIEEASRH